ncbi:retrovirus-related pol polyprotein from transposon TNT 1-94 [Tanacetum coccineum]
MVSNKTKPGTSQGSNTLLAPSSSSVDLRLSKFSCAKHGLVRGLPKLKFEKDHLCSACAMGKSKKQSHKPKSEDTIQEKLYLLHMNLCGPIRVASVNGKKYILVIVDDYSRFTWVNFLASKDEAPDFIIKFLKMIQVRLNATVKNIRIDNGTEFFNQTLRDYYEQALQITDTVCRSFLVVVPFVFAVTLSGDQSWIVIVVGVSSIFKFSFVVVDSFSCYWSSACPGVLVNIFEEEDGGWIRFLGGNSSSGIKKYRGLNSNDGGNTGDGVKIAGGVIGSSDEIEFSEELKELLPAKGGK